MNLVLAAGSRRVSILSLNGALGRAGSKNCDSLASKSSLPSGAPSNSAETKTQFVAVEREGHAGPTGGIGRTERVETTRVAWRSSDTSSSTKSMR